jgi:hypothetical protein
VHGFFEGRKVVLKVFFMVRKRARDEVLLLSVIVESLIREVSAIVHLAKAKKDAHSTISNEDQIRGPVPLWRRVKLLPISGAIIDEPSRFKTSSPISAWQLGT